MHMNRICSFPPLTGGTEIRTAICMFMQIKFYSQYEGTVNEELWQRFMDDYNHL